MNTREPAPSSETPLGENLLYALRYYLGGRRAWLAFAALVGLAGLVLNWSWLVAIGVAPLLIAVLPCVVMCALGLCMNRMMGGSCSPEETARTSAQPEADTNLSGDLELPLALVDEPDQPPVEAGDSESTRGDAELAQSEDDPTVSDGLAETTTERS